ncbi:DCR1B exonuclease, partial [Erythrocercus mccallii]|nr:DCR1B exonuclease [Erythrocercus mccallii]
PAPGRGPAPPRVACACAALPAKSGVREAGSSSAMAGTVLPGTPIAVDFWSVRKAAGARLFFLSHMHSDHTVGLCVPPAPGFGAWAPSCATALTSRPLQVPMCWIRALEVGQSHVVDGVTVTLIDSNHCPGSVMFLFEGTFGTILYTGDFRYTSAMQDEPVLRGRHIDCLYLDNTYCHPQRVLPSRALATCQAIRLIRAHPQHHVAVGVYTLGKEMLLVELALEFSTWVVVSPWRLEQMRLLELPDVFTTEESAGWIRAVDVAEIRRDTVAAWNALHPTIAIIPTGRPMRAAHPNIHVIPYSDHSSFAELREFVKWLKPCSIVPILKDDVCQLYFQEYLSSAPKVLPNFKDSKPVLESGQQQRRRREQKPTSLCKRAPQCSAPRGVVYESPEKNTEKPEALTDVKVPQHYREPALCSKEGCTSLKDKKEGLRGEQVATARAAPVSSEPLVSGFAEKYLLTPLNVLKRNSAQTFDQAVEEFLRR